MTIQPLTTPPGAISIALRPLAYALWGLLFLSAAVALPLFLVLVFNTWSGPAERASFEKPPESVSVEKLGAGLIFIVFLALFVVLVLAMEWLMLSQAMLGFVFVAQALSRHNTQRRIAVITGKVKAAWLEPNISTPATRFWAAIARVPRPEKWFYLSALAVGLGFGLGMLVPPGGVVLLAAALVFHILVVILRVRVELAARPTTALPENQPFGVKR